MLTDEDVEVVRDWSRRFEVGQEFTLTGLKAVVGNRANDVGKSLKSAIEAGDPRVAFVRFVGYDDEGKPRVTSQHHTRFIRVE